MRRLAWVLRQPIAVLVLELGANDGLRGLDIAQLETNLDSIVVATRATFPDVRVVIAGMQAPPDLGTRYSTEFQSVFVRLASRHDAALIPFISYTTDTLSIGLGLLAYVATVVVLAIPVFIVAAVISAKV